MRTWKYTFEYHLKKFCKDDITRIENYDIAKSEDFKGWDCHHRLELTLDNEFANSKEDLIRYNMYYNRPYFELILLRKSEHSQLHQNTYHFKQYNSKLNKDKPKSEHMKMALSNSLKGRKFTDEWRENLSKACMGRNKGKPLSEINRINKAKAQQEIGIKYREYKANGGYMNYNEFRKSIKKR